MNLYVKKLLDDSIVSTIPWTGGLSENRLEKVLSGMLRQMNTEEFYVDDQEVEDAIEKGRP